MTRSIYRIAGTSIAIGLMTAFVCLRPASAEHFDITLTADSGGDRASATTDTTPPIGGVNPRQVLKLEHGAQLKIVWKMASGFPHGVMKNVTVHFFVVRQTALGQKPVPDPSGEGGVVNNSFVMDFGPKAAASGMVTIKAPDAGFYLVRVQSEDTHVEHGHEHFAALDLNVQ